MSKQDIVTVKTVCIKDAFGPNKDGVCGVYISNKVLLEFLEELIERKENFYLKYEDMTIEEYVKSNYENMFDQEIKEFEKKCKVIIYWYTCEDKK